MILSGVTIIKNGLRLGYPFVESILSILDICDEMIISEGYSEDGTDIILDEAFGSLPKVKIFHDHWPVRTGGRAIAEITDRAVARASGEWIYYIQADEIVHEDSAPKIKYITRSNTEANSAAFSFLHFTDSWNHTAENPAYIAALRMFRNGRKIFSHLDGWSFHGEVDPVLDCTKECQPVFHYGWVFKENVGAKRQNLAQLYSDKESYQKEASSPDPAETNPPNYFGTHPRVVQPLLSLDRYSPLGIKV